MIDAFVKEPIDLRAPFVFRIEDSTLGCLVLGVWSTRDCCWPSSTVPHWDVDRSLQIPIKARMNYIWCRSSAAINRLRQVYWNQNILNH